MLQRRHPSRENISDLQNQREKRKRKGERESQVAQSSYRDILDGSVRVKRADSIIPGQSGAKYADSVGGCYAFAVMPTKNGSIKVAPQRYGKGSAN